MLMPLQHFDVGERFVIEKDHSTTATRVTIDSCGFVE